MCGGQWRPTTNTKILELRAELLDRARQYFRQRSVLEVETPILSESGIQDPNIDSVVGNLSAMSTPYYLQTSPELFMKRLLAAGSGDIYQICKVFRDGESGTKHNQEFTMVEWYRLGFDHLAMMDETVEFCRTLLAGHYDISAVDRLSYAELIAEYAQVDVFGSSSNELTSALQDHAIDVPAGASTQQMLDLILAVVVEPKLPVDRISCVYGYPKEQASLARLDSENPETACRFEIFLGSLELANGYYELTDPTEQRQRFEEEARQRQDLDKPAVPLDEKFLAALDAGLPDCAGVAVGFDRLLMLAAGKNSIADVISFPLN